MNERRSYKAHAGAPVGVERGAREMFVMVMPLVGVHVVDRTPRDGVDFVELRCQPAAGDRTPVHDRDCSVRVLAGARGAEEHAHQTLDARLESGLLRELAQHRVCR